MTEDRKKDFLHLLDIISGINYIRPEDLPNISLYMDQVTTFMDEHLSSTRRHEDDKILTKTMINNYTKNRLLPPSEKKRYSKEHLLMLIFIYYFKNMLSINDIQTLLSPLKEEYFQPGTGEKDMTFIYEEIYRLAIKQSRDISKDLFRQFLTASGAFQDESEEDREYLTKFAFICLMSFDIYVRKFMIEHMIDEMSQKKTSASEKKGKKESRKSRNP